MDFEKNAILGEIYGETWLQIAFKDVIFLKLHTHKVKYLVFIDEDSCYSKICFSNISVLFVINSYISLSFDTKSVSVDTTSLLSNYKFIITLQKKIHIVFQVV